MRAALFIILAALGLALVAGFFGSVHGIGDSLAVFRFPISVAMMFVIAALMHGKRRLAAIVIVALALAANPALARLQVLTGKDGGAYRLYQKNLLYKNDDQAALARDILDEHPDFVTLQEIWDDTLPVFDAIRGDFAASLACFGGVGNSAAVLSRYPTLPGGELCRDDLGVAGLHVVTPDGPVWLISLHLPWPWPYPQTERLNKVVPILKALDGPVILAGDFNMVPWSNTMRQVQAATGAERAGPVLDSFVGLGGLLRLPIDHVLTPRGQGHVQLRPLLGSDHLGVVADFDLSV